MRADVRVVRAVAGWCLGYPDAELRDRLPVLKAAIAEQRRSEPVLRLSRFLTHVEETDQAALIDHYVRVFDLDRKATLYLSYWTDGDTRRRGSTLAAFKQRYRASGWLVDTRGELPDHLPLVLEYAALADPVDGNALLLEYRASLELIRLALEEQRSAYADVLNAVCATLPGPSPKDRMSAMALARTGPPAESVGLDPLPFPTVGRPDAEVTR